MKNSKHLVSFILAMILSLFSFSPAALATEMRTANSDISNEWIPLSESSFSREEALELLGVTEAEAERMSLFVVDAEPIDASSLSSGLSTCSVTIGPNAVHQFPSFSFTGTNIGSYWTCAGTKLKFSAVYHSAANVNTPIDIFLYGWGMENPNDIFEGVTAHVLQLMPGNTYTMNGFVNAHQNYDYHFVYYGGNNSTLTMIVAVY